MQETETNMKSTTLKCIAAITIYSALANPIWLAGQESNEKQIRYSVTRLGTLGGIFSGAYAGVNSKGWAAGDSSLQGDQTEHGFLWRTGVMTDLGTLGGPNSAASFINDRGLIVGSAQTPEADPNGEGWGQGFSCPNGPGPNGACQGYDKLVLPYLWRNGVMTALPTRGGNNGQANDVNNLGQVVGWAENSTVVSCAPPQVLEIEAVIWGPDADEIQELPPLHGDAIAAAIALNDEGQVVGLSGICGVPSLYLGVHAVLWQNGSVIDLGGFGGGHNNAAWSINNRGQVVGQSDLPGDTITHAFLWQNGMMTDLGTLRPSDVFSQAISINDRGQIVGNSCDASFNCLPFVWEDGVMTDLNTLIPPDSPLQLTFAADINAEGQITGVALDKTTSEMPAFVATPEAESSAAQLGPNPSSKVVLPDNVRKLLQQRSGFGRFGARLMKHQ